MASNTKTLLNLEDLALPSFQVIVMTANMGCSECRKRVSQVITKITGVREFIVDVSNKQVIIKADFGIRWDVKNDISKTYKTKDWHPHEFFKCLAPICVGKQISLSD
ncbi:uncharacterized protein LOC120120770 [Hibiscus syriacus]|uniref:uncharacterized protein LOC120120770 n=1 Tax=Hibiscus syriacus TaxID=106335 RepID=UPI001923DFAF|nr:uncharacterized protein LOC120120770 [Hibiscus syriacus]